jgi:AbrB family looped-hinge helix DNA binding protein
MHRSKVTSKGQIVIPADLRDKYHIEKGTPVSFIEEDNRLYLVPVTSDLIRKGFGMFKPIKGEKSMLQILQEERKRDAAREKKKSPRYRSPT